MVVTFSNITTSIPVLDMVPFMVPSQGKCIVLNSDAYDLSDPIPEEDPTTLLDGTRVLLYSRETWLGVRKKHVKRSEYQYRKRGHTMKDMRKMGKLKQPGGASCNQRR